MSSNLTLQTSAAFERINEALMGKTVDDLGCIIVQLEELSKKAKEIRNVTACLMSGDC